MTTRFDLGHDLDLVFSRSNMEFPICQSKFVRLPQNEMQTYRLNSRPQMWPMGLTLTMTLTFEWEGQLTLHTGGGSRSFMTMTMTIWLPRSGVWIYQIVTGITSVVGVPSLVLYGDVIQMRYEIILSHVIGTKCFLHGRWSMYVFPCLLSGYEACRLFGAKQVSALMISYWYLGPVSI